MSNNKYMDAIEEALVELPKETVAKHASSDFFVALALVKELQTLNETLKEVIDYTYEGGQQVFFIRIRP
jgi:hypothetical protein